MGHSSRLRSILVAAACGLIASASPALADVFTETVPVTGPVDGTGVPDEPLIFITAPAFNQTLGIVTGLSAEWFGALDPNVQYVAVSNGAGPANGLFEATMTPFLSIDSSGYVDLPPINLPVSCSNGACQSLPASPVQFDETFVLAAAPDPFPLPAVASVNPTLPKPLNPEDAFDTSVLHSSVTFSFTFTPTASVPEPPSWALLLAGGLGVFGVTRRKGRAAG
jgi:hypothetical protein